MFSFEKKKFIELLLVLVFRLSLDISYVVYISKVYAYSGFNYNPDFIKIVESYAITFILLFCLNKSDKKVSVITTKLLYVIMIIPVFSLYALNDGPRAYVYFVFFGFLLTLLIIKLPHLKIPRVTGSNYIALAILASITVITYSTLFILNGVPSLKAFNLLSVYEIRSSVVFGPSFMGYFVVWQAKVVNMFILGLGIYKKNVKLVLFAIALQVILFLILGSKSTLFAPIFVLAVIFILKKNRFLLYSVIGLTSVVLISLTLHFTGVSILPASLFIRRLLFVPAINNFYYFDFFNQNPQVYLSQSLFQGFIQYPYEMPVANLIGEKYYGSSEGWVNTGYLAEAFMNFGLIGMILFSTILGFILLLLDSVMKSSRQTLAISVAIVGLFSLLDGGLFTVLLTHGLLFSIVILVLYAKKGDS